MTETKPGEGDKRKVSTDALETLGTIIGPGEKRDAIHLAVLPAVAGMVLRPGEDVRMLDGVAVSCTRDDGVGIVDPFLQEARVPSGAHFWLVIYPRKINSLRHVWSHPALPDEPGVTEAKPGAVGSKEYSEQWLRDFCARSNCPGYEETLALAVESDGDSLHVDGQDASGEIPPEFWDHVEVVTGRKINPESRASWFSCSC